MTNKLTLHDFNLDFVPEKQYAAALDRAKTPAELVENIAYYRIVADDAYRCAQAITEADWAEWRRGLESERAGVFAGEAWAERYVAILMPEVMFNVSMVAVRFKVPWSVAFKRLVDVGELVRSTDNVYRMRKAA